MPTWQHRIRGLIAAILLLAAPVAGGAVPESGCLVAAHAHEADYASPLVDFIQNAGPALGTCIKAVSMPPKRAEELLVSGRIDIDLIRTTPFFAKHPQTHRVPTPLIVTKGIFVTLADAPVKPETLDQAADLRVGVLRAAVWTGPLLGDRPAVQAPSYAALLQMLQAGRIDAALMDDASLGIAEAKVPGVQLWRGPALTALPIHLALAPQHGGLVDRLDALVRAALVDGGALGPHRWRDWISANRQPEVRYGISNDMLWAPYFLPDDQRMPGILPDLVHRLLLRADLRPRAVLVTRDEAKTAFTAGRLDIVVTSPSWYPEGLPAEQISVPLLDSRDLVIGPAHGAAARRTDGPPRLAGRRVATVRSYSYHDGDRFQRVDHEDEAAVVRAVAAGETPFGIVGDRPLASLRQCGLADEIVVLGEHSHGDLVIQVRPGRETLLPRLNTAIAALWADGAVDAVVINYQTDVAVCRNFTLR